jgi:hypothetical protein
MGIFRVSLRSVSDAWCGYLAGNEGIYRGRAEVSLGQGPGGSALRTRGAGVLPTSAEAGAFAV